MGHLSFFHVFGKDWGDSITSENIISDLKATGIHSFNPDAIPDVAGDREFCQRHFTGKSGFRYRPDFPQSRRIHSTSETLTRLCAAYISGVKIVDNI